MITACVGEERIRVDRVVNKGGWFGVTWLLRIPCGFECLCVLVEAEHETAVVEELQESSWFLKWCGNDSELTLEGARLDRCTAKWFEPNPHNTRDSR